MPSSVHQHNHEKKDHKKQNSREFGDDQRPYVWCKSNHSSQERGSVVCARGRRQGAPSSERGKRRRRGRAFAFAESVCRAREPNNPLRAAHSHDLARQAAPSAAAPGIRGLLPTSSNASVRGQRHARVARRRAGVERTHPRRGRSSWSPSSLLQARRIESFWPGTPNRDSPPLPGRFGTSSRSSTEVGSRHPSGFSKSLVQIF